MNAPQLLLSYRNLLAEHWTSTWTQVVMWALLAVAGLLLVGFVSVVEDITQRGETLRAQQRVSSTSVLAGDSQIRSKKVERLLSASGELLAER
jgi:hypothetical protein